MLHKVWGRKLGRDKNQRRALFRSLANQLILNEKIITTEAKAKAVRPMIEKLVTRAKTNNIHNRRLIISELTAENTTQKMLELIGPKFKDRPGGYTRIVRMGARAGDRAQMVSLMFVEAPSKIEVPKRSAKKEVAVEVKEEEKTSTYVKQSRPRARRTKKETNEEAK